MFRKIGIISFVTLTIGIAGAYFHFTGKLVERGKMNHICRNINVVITDSVSRSLLKPEDVKELAANQIGQHLDSINTTNLEQKITKGTVIRNAQFYTIAPDILSVKVSQRFPVVRIMDKNGGYYLDESGLKLPLTACEAQNLPTVTGTIHNSDEWIKSLIEYTEFIRNDPYWCDEIEQIHIGNDGTIELYARSISQKIIFGDMFDVKEKFEKLAVFYSTILPEATASNKKYKVVNLKYKDQIICK